MFDREKYIQGKMEEHWNEANALNYEIIAVVLQGSQNYNLDIYSDQYISDVDTKAILLPSFDDFCSGNSPISTTYIRQNNEHIDLKDIRVIFETFKKQNVNFVEILFSKYCIVKTKYLPYWKRLQQLGEELTHCHPSQTLKTMAGLSFEKHKALCHPYPTIKDRIEKYGYDGKQLHHIIRINEFMKNYLAGMSFRDCLSKHSMNTLSMMINAKLNMFPLNDALKIADQLNNETDKLKNDFIEKYGTECNSTPYQKLEEIKIDVLKQWFREELHE